MPIFEIKKNKSGKLKIAHSCIINYGVKEDDNLRFLTKDGVKTEPIKSFWGSLKAIEFNDICLDYLMLKWSKLNNNVLPIVLDESIETYETYTDKSSVLTLMIERRADEIAIKPIFKIC